MWEIYDTRSNKIVAHDLCQKEAMMRANSLNDRYAMQLIMSGKAPKDFDGVFMIRKK